MWESGDKEEINGGYIAKILGNDWGFYYTVNQNLTKLKEFFDKYELSPREDKAN